MKEMITIDNNEQFKLLKKALGKKMKSKCDFCGKKLDYKTFGYISLNTASCRDALCLTQAILKEEVK